MSSYFESPFSNEKWTRFPESLSDEKIIEAAATHGITVDSIDRMSGVVHFKGTHDDEKALHDILLLWAKEQI